MATNTDPIFGYTPITSIVRLTADIASSEPREATLPDQGIVLAYTAGAAGAKVTSIDAKVIGGSSQAGLVLIYVTDDSDDIQLVREITVDAVSPDGTIPSALSVEVFEDFQLSPGQKIYAGMLSISKWTNVIFHIADYEIETT